MIQIDMPMPKSCNECPIQGETFHCCPLVEGIPEWQREISEDCKDKRSAHCPLKEQEEVEPTLIRERWNKYFNDYVCPRCDNEVVYEQNYCSECGLRFLWGGSDGNG